MFISQLKLDNEKLVEDVKRLTAECKILKDKKRIKKNEYEKLAVENAELRKEIADKNAALDEYSKSSAKALKILAGYKEMLKENLDKIYKEINTLSSNDTILGYENYIRGRL